MNNFSSIYLADLYLKNVRAFKGEYYINFSDKCGKPNQWSVILGNNNTGKTTILRAIADLEPKKIESHNPDIEASRREFMPNNLKKYFTSTLTNELVVPQEPFGKGINGAGYDYDLGLNIVIRTTLTNSIKDSVYKSSKLNGFSNYAWGFGHSNWSSAISGDLLETFKFFGYGPSRRISPLTFQSQVEETDATIGLFRDIELLNVEEWFLQTDYAQKNGSMLAVEKIERIKILLFKSGILPDVIDIRFTTDEKLKSFVEIRTGQDWVRFQDLSYGYQSMIAWLADLAKRMFDRYPDLENPLHGPAIVLIDEIDLHLHPEWQRKIIKYLSDLFPNTQFIVTAHSPLIVQSAENVNLIMLEKDDDTGSINVRQQFGSFQGWTVEEILRELMDMGEKTRSDRFLELLNDFETGLDQENYDKAKQAYDELDKLLHPASSQRKLLSIQLSSLVPA